jgi:hypothetical protein
VASPGKLTVAVKKVLVPEDHLAGAYVECRIEIADGDLLPGCNLLQGADSELMVLEKDKGIGVARVVDHGRDHVKGISNEPVVVCGPQGNAVEAQLDSQSLSKPVLVRWGSIPAG